MYQLVRNVFAAALAVSGISYAQTTTPPVVSSFLVESAVPLSGVDAVTNPSIPSDVSTGLQSGAIELREQIKYVASSKTATVKGFLVPAGSPATTPDGAGGVTAVWSYIVQVDRAITTAKNGIVLTGSVLNNQGGSPFGDLTGAEVVISTMYMTPVDPVPVANTAFNGVSVDVVGLASLFSKSGYGTVSLSTSGTNPQSPIANAGKRLITRTSTFQLSAAGSSDPMGGTLTYSWKFIPIYGQTAQIMGADTATPTVILPDYSDAQGDYTFELTVTNSAGMSATDTVVVTYDVGPQDQQQ